MRLKRLICSIVSLLALAFASSATAAPTTSTLSGAGSSLMGPLVAAWGGSFNALFGVTVGFTAINSPGAVSELGSNTVDFGASEAPLGALPSCAGCIQVPWAVTGIAIGYNVPGAGRTLRLTPTVLADIYLGQITRWNDAQIKALNPHLSLPNLAITPLSASASSVTYVFSDYLSKVDAAWKSRVGVGTTVSVPAGVTAPSDGAASSQLANTSGAIAFVGPDFLFAHNLPAAAIQNAAGAYVYPNLGNIQAAANTVKSVPASGALDIVDPPKKDKTAYPLSAFSYIDVSSSAAADVKTTLGEWIRYAIGLGQHYCPSLDFGKLPTAVVNADRSAVTGFGG